MLNQYVKEREREREVAEANGYNVAVCIKENWFQHWHVGESYCYKRTDLGYHLYASWSSDSFLCIIQPERMDEHFAKLVGLAG